MSICSVIILHTNDVHGAISEYAKIAALEDSYTAKDAEVILMDAGDFIQDSIYVSNSKGESAIQMMNTSDLNLTKIKIFS